MQYLALGPLEVRDSEGSVALGGAKQRALLALLLLNANRVVSRDRIVDQLWGDQPPETAVQSVQVYVSRLRKLLPPETLLTRAPGYVLEADPEDLDLQQFERLLVDGRTTLATGDAERASRVLRDALALWRGPALADFAFEAFAQAEIGRLEDLRLSAVEERVEADLALERHADLIGELEALIAANPHRERLRCQLMLALYRSGRQAEALDAYRQARDALDELGIEPSARLRELERAILTQDSSLRAPRRLTTRIVLPAALGVAPPFPFVGRARELDALRSLLHIAAAGEGAQVALVSGEPGSGKTRLVRELAEEAADRGALVLYGTSDAVITTPYQPFVESLEFLVRVADPEALRECVGTHGGELARLLPDLALRIGPLPAPQMSDPDTERHRLHIAVAEFLARVSSGRSILLIVEDIHWADAATLRLFRHLARAEPDTRMFLLATYRERSEDVRPQFADALADLSRIEVTRVAIGGLSTEDVAEFIRRSVGADESVELGMLANSIGKLTDGTPFFLCELWRALIETGTVQISGTSVRLARPIEELGSPERVREVVHYRLSRLAPATTETLELAAVAGTQFELSLLGDEDSLVAALDEAIRSGMIEEVPGPGLAHRFAHELVRRALYDRLTGIRRAELHLRVGQALERAYAANPVRVLADLAHHFTLAAPLGGTERAVDYNIRAAAAATESLAFEAAADRLLAALQVGITRDVERARVQLELGRALHYAGMLAQADSVLSEAMATAASAGDPGLEAHAAIVRGDVRLRTDETGAHEEMRETAEAAIETFARIGDDRGLAHASRLLSRSHSWHGRWRATEEVLRRALAHAESVENGRERMAIVPWLLVALYYGPTPAPVAISECEAILAECAGDAVIEGTTSCFLCGLLAMTGRFDEARELGLRGTQQLDDLGFSLASGPMRAYVAEAELLAGDAQAAERELLTAIQTMERLGDREGALGNAYEVALVLCAQRRYAEAEEWAAQKRGTLEESDVMTRMAGLTVEAHLESLAGRLDTAERYARRAVDLGEKTDALNAHARALLALSDVLKLAGRRQQAGDTRARALRLYETKGNVAAAAQIRATTASSPTPA
jgi:DNA-binding SARP family transcriptional activator